MEKIFDMVKQWAIDNDYICDSLELLNRINMQKTKKLSTNKSIMQIIR